MGDFSNPFQDRSEIMRHADIEAKDAEIARLRDALATARLEGMEEMAEKLAAWHEERSKDHEVMEREFRAVGQHLEPNAMQSAVRYAEAASMHRQRAATIRAAAKEVKP